MRAVVRGTLALGLLVAALAGCAPPPLIHPVSPAALDRSVEVRQQITATYKNDTRSLQVALRVAPNDLTLIGLSAIGQRLFTLAWQNDAPKLTSELPDVRHLDPKRVLADLELACWPLSSLRPALIDPDLRLEQLGTTRTLWRGNRLLWIAYRDGDDPLRSRMTLYNVAAGYRLDIRPLAFDGDRH